MIKNIFKNIIKTFVSFNLVVLPAFGTGPETSERTLDKIDVFLKSSSPSDIPFIDYMERFIPDNSQPLKRFNLSAFEGKKLFVGYGVYDAGQNYCKYVEKPGTKDSKLYFDSIMSFNKHTYAISKGTMSYNNCVALANDFGGLPAVITSASENTFVQGIHSVSNTNKWIGTERTNCNSPYINKIGDKQVYTNFSNTTDAQCVEGKLNLSLDQKGSWKKTDADVLNYCVVEVDSEDFRRPIKVCTPWWKIERDYANPVVTTFNGVDIYKINQADIPEQFNVCVKYQDSAMKAQQEKPNREVTCTSYYDTQVAPECIRNPKQAICFVDECNGYIKNACKKIEDYKGFKPYTKAQSIIDKTDVIIKGKLDITTHIYDCPPSPPSSKSCEEQATVIIYPKECPNNSDCEGRKQCIQKAVTTEEKSKCSVDFKCEKIYGNPDSTVFDVTGELTHLKNVCSDGTELTFEINTQNKTSKKCLEYEYYDLSEQVTQNCILKRPYSDYTVDTTLTEEDIYMNDKNCIRLNNVMEARPTVEVKIDYKNMGFAKTVIKKSFLDESQNNIVNEGLDSTTVEASKGILDPFNQKELDLKNATDKYQDPYANMKCDEFTEIFNNRNDVLNTKVVTTSGRVYVTNSIKQESNKIILPFVNVMNETDCKEIKEKIVSPGLETVSYEYDFLTKYCKVESKKLTGDIFSSINGNGTLKELIESSDNSKYFEYDSYTYITKESVNRTECERIAYCLNGQYNETEYGQVGLNQCKITTGEGYDFVEKTNIEELTVTKDEHYDDNCKPLSTSGSYLSQFNGTQDIFSIQEVVSGDFGYYSNYNTHPFSNNVIKVNDKEVYPIKKINVIDDALIYTGIIDQISINTKKPNILLGFMLGGIVGVLIVMFITKAIKLNEQYIDWELYKLVPVERYKENVYGYDKRIIELNEQGTMKIVNGKIKLIYAKNKGFTGTLKPGAFKDILKRLLVQKESLITCLGFERANVQSLNSPFEYDVQVPYPKCKTFTFGCDKRNSEEDTIVRNPFTKKMTNSYVGAVNGVSIVVPYLGEYEVKAYDQFDNLLGSMLVKEDEFIDMTNSMAKYAQINFGLSMELADGINEGRTEYACRNDLMVEWGGGVSGIYYENNFTGSNSNCQKSHDSYVRTSSATKLTIKSTGIDRPHIIQLEKPLPFANRVFLVTLNKKEIRQYRCFKDFGECQTDSFK